MLRSLVVFTVASFSIALGGCAGSVLGDAIAGPEAVAAREDAYCKSIGLQFGTPEYANCRLTVGSQRAQNHQAAVNNAAANLRTMNSPNTSRTCRSTAYAGQITTRCD